MTLKEAVAQSFALLEPIADFFPRTEELKKKAMQAWLMVLGAEGVTAQELKDALVLWMKTGEKMPKPSTILKLVAKTNPCSVIPDPVQTGEYGGVIEIGSKAVCEAKGLPYRPLTEETLKSLPVTQEQREKLMKRIDTGAAL